MKRENDAEKLTLLLLLDLFKLFNRLPEQLCRNKEEERTTFTPTWRKITKGQ